MYGVRPTGTYGIGTGTPEARLRVAIASRQFGIGAMGTQGTLNIGSFGLSTMSYGMRWRNATSTTNTNYTMNLTEYNSSVGGSDPLIAFSGVTLNPIPEPGTLTVLALGGAGLLLRRRRRPSAAEAL